MKPIVGLLLCSMFAMPAVAEQAPPDPEQWYRDSYAPLFADKPGENVHGLLDHYADLVTTHRAEGSPTRDKKREWLAKPMQEWLAEGWLNSALVGLQIDRINDSTTVFKAKWLDSYKSGERQFDCGWYLADYMDGRWQFTQYANLDCEAHGL